MEQQIQSPAIAYSLTTTAICKFVALAVCVNKEAIKRGGEAAANPPLEIYDAVCADDGYGLLVDKEFTKNYTVKYNILVKEKDKNNSDVFSYFGFVAVSNNNNDCVIAFRGTQNTYEIEKDKDVAPVLFDSRDRECGQVPRGFHDIFINAYAVPINFSKDFRYPLNDFALHLLRHIDDVNYKAITMTGHSLGAIMATYFTAFAASAQSYDFHLYTFASPKTGDDKFAYFFPSYILTESIRVVNEMDDVPNRPNKQDIDFDYTHITSQKLSFTSDGDLSIKSGNICAHQLPVYLYLLEGSKNPDILKVKNFEDCKK